MSALLAFVLLAVLVSFLCSLLEAVILSISAPYIAVSVKQGKRSGRILKELKSQIDRPLAAILTLNTVSHTVGAAGVGAQVHKIYGDGFVTISSALLTLTILIFSEIIPKTLGASNWKSLAPFAAYVTLGLIYAMYPFVWLSEKLYGWLSPDRENSLTREEMIMSAEISASEGGIRPKESAIIKNLLMLDNIKVMDIMTPRAVIYALEKGQLVGEIIESHRPIRFSRIPVFVDDLDHIEGIVHRYKILEASSHDMDNISINSMITPVHSIPENISVAAALDQFIKRREHVFIVVDEYGSTTGLVSLEDAIETLLGVEIVDEFDSVADMRQYALDLWRERKSKQLN